MSKLPPVISALLQVIFPSWSTLKFSPFTIAEPLIVESVLEEKIDKNEFAVSGGNGAYQVSGPFIDNLIRGVVLEDTESNRYFQRRLVQRGVISELKKIGMVDGDTIQIAGHFFTYTE